MHLRVAAHKAMVAILPFLLCLQSEVTMTTIGQFSHIALALLAMTGRVTLLGLSRWTGAGGSYRTILRFSLPPCPGLRCSGPSFARTCSILTMSICSLVMKPSSAKPVSIPTDSIASLPLWLASPFPPWPSSPCR
jgi:hypothetical protein